MSFSLALNAQAFWGSYKFDLDEVIDSLSETYDEAKSKFSAFINGKEQQFKDQESLSNNSQSLDRSDINLDKSVSNNLKNNLNCSPAYQESAHDFFNTSRNIQQSPVVNKSNFGCGQSDPFDFLGIDRPFQGYESSTASDYLPKSDDDGCCSSGICKASADKFNSSCSEIDQTVVADTFGDEGKDLLDVLSNYNLQTMAIERPLYFEGAAGDRACRKCLEAVYDIKNDGPNKIPYDEFVEQTKAKLAESILESKLNEIMVYNDSIGSFVEKNENIFILKAADSQDVKELLSRAMNEEAKGNMQKAAKTNFMYTNLRNSRAVENLDVFTCNPMKKIEESLKLKERECPNARKMFDKVMSQMGVSKDNSNSYGKNFANKIRTKRKMDLGELSKEQKDTFEALVKTVSDHVSSSLKVNYQAIQNKCREFKKRDLEERDAEKEVLEVAKELFRGTWEDEATGAIRNATKAELKEFTDKIFYAAAYKPEIAMLFFSTDLLCKLADAEDDNSITDFDLMKNMNEKFQDRYKSVMSYNSLQETFEKDPVYNSVKTLSESVCNLDLMANVTSLMCENFGAYQIPAGATKELSDNEKIVASELSCTYKPEKYFANVSSLDTLVSKNGGYSPNVAPGAQKRGESRIVSAIQEISGVGRGGSFSSGRGGKKGKSRGMPSLADIISDVATSDSSVFSAGVKEKLSNLEGQTGASDQGRKVASKSSSSFSNEELPTESKKSFTEQMQEMLQKSTDELNASSIQQQNNSNFNVSNFIANQPLTNEEIEEAKEKDALLAQEFEQVKRELAGALPDDKDAEDVLKDALKSDDIKKTTGIENEKLLAEIERLKKQIADQAVPQRVSQTDKKLEDRINSLEKELAEYKTAAKSAKGGHSTYTMGNGSLGFGGKSDGELSGAKTSGSIGQRVGRKVASLGSGANSIYNPANSPNIEFIPRTVKMNPEEFAPDFQIEATGGQLLLTLKDKGIEKLPIFFDDVVTGDNGQVAKVYLAGKPIEMAVFNAESRKAVQNYMMSKDKSVKTIKQAAVAQAEVEVLTEERAALMTRYSDLICSMNPARCKAQ